MLGTKGLACDDSISRARSLFVAMSEIEYTNMA